MEAFVVGSAVDDGFGGVFRDCAELSGFGVAPSACGAVPAASVVDEEPAVGGGGVVGVGVVDFDVVDGLGGVGGFDGVEVDGLSGVVAEGVFCGELAGGGEAFALDVEGVGCCGGDLAGAGGQAQGRHVVVCEGCGDGCCGGLSGVGVGGGDAVAFGDLFDGFARPVGEEDSGAGGEASVGGGFGDRGQGAGPAADGCVLAFHRRRATARQESSLEIRIFFDQAVIAEPEGGTSFQARFSEFRVDVIEPVGELGELALILRCDVSVNSAAVRHNHEYDVVMKFIKVLP